MKDGVQILEALASTKGLRVQVLHRALSASKDGALLQSDPSSIILVVRCLQSEWSPSSNPIAIDHYFRLVQNMTQKMECPGAIDHVMQEVGTALVIIALMTEKNVTETQPMLIRWLAQQKPDLRTMKSMEVLMSLFHRIAQSPKAFTPKIVCGCLRLLASWTFVPANKRLILAKLPTFVHCIVLLSQPGNRAAKSINVSAATILKNMSSAAECLPTMMQAPSMVSTLHQLMTSKHVQVVEAAVWCVASLAADDQARTRLCRFRKGRIVRVLFALSKLGKARLESPISTAMSRLLQPRQTLMLCSQLFHRNSTRISEIFVAQTLNRVASSVSPNQETYPEIMDKLCSLSNSNNQYVRRVAVEGVFRQTQQPTGCFFLARNDHVVSALLRRARGERCKQARDMTIKTISALVLNPLNAKGISHRGKVIRTLVKSCQANQSEIVVEALANLAAHSSDISQTPKSCGLVECLAKFGVSTSTNKSLKKECLRCVVSLVESL